MLQVTAKLGSGAGIVLIVWLLGFLPATANAGFYSVEEARPMWVKADMDGDGYLSRAEIDAEVPALLPGFDHADINRDGKLDPGEFEILLISL